MSENWKWKDIRLFSIPTSEVTRLFQKRIETNHHSWYESTTSNILLQNPELICQNPEAVWREQELGAYGNRSRLRPDLIIESNTEVWIVEVKYPVSTTEIFKEGYYKDYAVVDQLYDYRDRINELGWWASKKRHLAVVWVYEEEMRKRKDIAEKHKLPTHSLGG